MDSFVQFCKKVRHYDDGSDFFLLVNPLADLFGFRPPKWNKLSLAAWTALKTGQIIQYTFYAYHCYQSAVKWRDLLYFSLNINVLVILSIGLFRAFTLVYYQKELNQLQAFVNGRACGRDDAKASFERKRKYWTNNRLVIAGSIALVLNAANWCLTAAFSEDLYQIPFALNFLPKPLRTIVEYYYSFEMLVQNFTYWQSFFQFASILSCLKVELAIISDYFKSIFDRAVEEAVGDDLEVHLEVAENVSKVWEALKLDLRQAAMYHSNFLRNIILLKNITRFNFMALLAASSILVTLNSFLCVVNFSSDTLGMLVFAAICCIECFCICRILDELDDINEGIGTRVYALDWLSALPKLPQHEEDYRSVTRTALIIQFRTQQGLGFRAGGMFDMNSEMFKQIMEMCYSWITFLKQTQQ